MGLVDVFEYVGEYDNVERRIGEWKFAARVDSDKWTQRAIANFDISEYNLANTVPIQRAQRRLTTAEIQQSTIGHIGENVLVCPRDEVRKEE